MLGIIAQMQQRIWSETMSSPETCVAAAVQVRLSGAAFTSLEIGDARSKKSPPGQKRFGFSLNARSLKTIAPLVRLVPDA